MTNSLREFNRIQPRRISLIDRLLNRFVCKLGYSFGKGAEHRRSLAIDLDERSLSSLLYLCQIRPFTIELPLDRARSNLYPLDQHVFGVAARRAIREEPPWQECIATTLAEYRRLVAYGNGADKLGLNPTEVPALAHTPSWLRVLPWVADSATTTEAGLRRTVIKEGLEHGFEFRSADEGFLTTGGDQVIEMHSRRLERVIESIRREGFRPAGIDGKAVTAELLIGDGNWCWQVIGGNHRVNAAFAIGLDSLPVEVTRLIFRRDAEGWPNVRSGLFPLPAAIQVFDNLVAGIAPAKAQAWLNSCASG